MKVTRFFSILFSRESNHCFGVCGYQFAVKIILFGTCTGLVKCSGVLNRSLLLQGREQISSLFLTSIFTIQKGGAEGKGLKMLCNTLVLHSLQHLWGVKSFILFCKHNFASKEGNERGRVDRACSVGNVVSCLALQFDWLVGKMEMVGKDWGQRCFLLYQWAKSSACCACERGLSWQQGFIWAWRWTAASCQAGGNGPWSSPVQYSDVPRQSLLR